MDISTVANFLLFLGAFAASFVTTDDAAAEEDPDAIYNSADYAREVQGTAGADDFEADGDNLAWFMDAGDDSLSGSAGQDYAALGTGDDEADMGAGNDLVEAGDGNDSVEGGTGDDATYGNLGDDTLWGQTGNDSLMGDEGDDDLLGGSGADMLAGGDGNDHLSGFDETGSATGAMTTADGADQLYGGAGNDSLLLGRGDQATGGVGNDSFTLDGRWHDGTGLFTINDYSAQEDSLAILYAPQIDPNTSLPITPTVSVQLSADGESSLILLNGVTVAQVEGVTDLDVNAIELHADTQIDASYRADQFDSVLPGSADADDLTGTAAEDYARLGAGDDTADLGAGNDSALGDAGDDTIAAEAGNDTLLGGEGQDDLNGGADNDILNGGTGADTLGGGDGADVVQGGAGNDIVSGYDANGAGGTVSAIDGADTLLGGDGDDTLIIGHGDTATGGTGIDTFALDATLNDSNALAIIQDFTEGTDKIELHYTPTQDALGNEIAPVVRVLSGPNGSYSVITVDGDPIAHVMGIPDLTLSAIILVAAV